MENTAYQWNAGGWFGSQIGATCWMLVAAAMLFAAEPTLALATLTVFAAVNAVGLGLWVNRERLDPLRAIQGLVVTAGLASLLVTYMLDSAGHFESLGVGGQVSAKTMYFLLGLMIPGLVVMFELIGRQGSGK